MEKDKTLKKKDPFIKIIFIQATACLLILLTFFLSFKLNPENFENLKKEYKSYTKNSIDYLEVFKTFKNYISKPMGNSNYKSKYTVSFSPYLVTFKAIEPVSGRVTSNFGRRKDPFTNEKSIHSGMDIACDEGTAIKVIENGTVLKVGEDDIAGKYVTVKHSQNLESFYCHLSEVIANKGDNVRKGERIALSGSTGLATGPHLHFELRIGDKKLDPQRLFKAV